MSLIKFSENYKTDKYALGYIHEFYANLFDPIQHTVTSVLEIGVQEGYSILLWRDFFSIATVTGVDINACDTIRNQERVVSLRVDAYTQSFVDSLQDNSYDIIIDDGPHSKESQEFLLDNYLSKLKPGGILIVEDIISTSYTPDLVKRIDSNIAKTTVYSMAGKQIDDKLKNQWSRGLDVLVVEKHAALV